jgi:hypothetical protein|tara:strand:+ start:232 stop:759 length:528 start_codon:yes stop_codon:yes gene_type:complete
MFQIESFKNAISARYGLARNNLWRIQLPTRPAYLGGDTFSERDGRILNLMCNATQLPGRQITTNDRQYGIKSEKMAQGFLKDDVSLSFYENNVYTIRRYFQDWQNRVLNQNSYEIRYKNEYAETVTMQQLDHEENLVAEVKLLEAFPTTLNVIDLTSEQNGLVQINVQLSYSNWR